MEELIVQLNSAINTRSLYPAEHPRVTAAAERFLSQLEREFEQRGNDEVTLLVVGRELVVDQQPLRRRGTHVGAFAATLRRRGLEGLTLLRGLERVECLDFLAAMSAAGAPPSSEHVIVGRVRAAVAGDEEPGRVREAYGDAVYDRLVDVKTQYDPGNVFHHNQNIRPKSDRRSGRR